MKFSATTLLSLFAVGASAAPIMHELKDIKADSALGMKVLSKARNLEDWEELQNTWVAGYSIKFQGCHHMSQWNEEADGEDDVRIVTKRLVRFRLCPTNYCSQSKSSGCSNGFGDYVIDMNSYLEAYADAQELQQDYQGQQAAQQQRDYYYDEDGNIQYNDQAQYYEEGQEDMDQYNQYQYEQAYLGQDIKDYMECSAANFGRRKLEEQQQQQQDQEQQDNYMNNYGYNPYQWDGQYYVGPYCASQGGAIYLGVFTDDSCTEFADDNGGRVTYSALTGGTLPYGDSSMVSMDCISCREPDENNYYGNDGEDADDVLELCENLYSKAGKCETNLPYGTVFVSNENACNYIEGIKIVRKDGTVSTAAAKANRTAAAFIGTLGVAFLGLSAYVYYLKTKLERASITLNDE